ncbi:YebG family protein [Ferrimonas lipolytica]|uniref:YebG family protein n=1 Tax=Ferrimonas lipolytica TaxID=2724191 RepID=A0A6H1UEK7_9GAMM|nr:YebG family protein [Ferrimonas lipolytica]QIZ76773.1 YebG family protein [Ferrimonas lipolytica]
MAVIVKYVVERNGEEVMTFSSKQEADAYDKMLDLADQLVPLLADADMLSDQQQEDLALYLAKQKESLLNLLKGKRPAPTAAVKAEPKPKAKPRAKTASAA